MWRVLYTPNVTQAFVTLWRYNRWKLQCVASLVQKGWNEELLFDLTSCRVCILSGIGLNEKKENCYFCDPDECCFLTLSATHSFYAYPTLEVKFLLAVGSLQKWRISQHFSLSLSVIRNRLCLLSFSRTETKICCLKFPPSFDGDFSLTYLLLWLCGPLSWQVCLNVSDRSQGKTGRKGKLPGFFSPR